ncbi:MAG: hypothetical protein ACLFQG_09035 [Desulfovermiculus sp.]
MTGSGRSWRSFFAIFAGLVVGLSLLVISISAGCSSLQPEPNARAFQGRIVYKELEGGFFGILTEKGERLNPVNLPAKCRQNGLRVQGTYRVLEQTMTIQMWGEPVELLRITCQEIDKSNGPSNYFSSSEIRF